MFQFKSKSFLFKLTCFNSSRDFFMSRFFFSSREFFFHVEIFISSRDFYLMSTVFSYRHFSFKEENIFYLRSRFLFSSRSFKWTFLNSRRDVTQEYLLASPGNDKRNKITWRSVF